MEQQTAVEWLEKQFDRYTSAGVRVPNDKIFKLTEKAKEIEKDQINRACYDGYYQEEPFDVRNYYDQTYLKNVEEIGVSKKKLKLKSERQKGLPLDPETKLERRWKEHLDKMIHWLRSI